MTQPILSTDDVLALFGRLGSSLYFGEPVSQTEHALQTAWLAEQAAAPPTLIAAALLHDVGHLLVPSEGVPESTRGDPGHAESGAGFLAAVFPDEVVAPVRLHVVAKRYLCTAEPGYVGQLTAASQASLTPQGGLMSAEQAARFLAQPHAEAALALRRWDEMARVAGLATPSLAHFRPLLEALAVRPA